MRKCPIKAILIGSYTMRPVGIENQHIITCTRKIAIKALELIFPNRDIDRAVQKSLVRSINALVAMI